jgi:O-methyltransferase
MFNNLIRKAFNLLGYSVVRLPRNSAYSVIKPLDVDRVEILADSAFRDSCNAVKNHTLLDTERLANIWGLCLLTDPNGAMIEIGTYRGGGALHLANCCPDRTIIAVDPFSEESFEELDVNKDSLFHKGQFKNTSFESVRELLRDKNAKIYKGYFPSVILEQKLPKISFAHLDVDTYKATKESLRYLLNSNVLGSKSLIVSDDYRRSAKGVDQAIAEIVDEVPGTLVFPMFPGQALIVPKSWYSELR